MAVVAIVVAVATDKSLWVRSWASAPAAKTQARAPASATPTRRYSVMDMRDPPGGQKSGAYVAQVGDGASGRQVQCSRGEELFELERARDDPLRHRMSDKLFQDTAVRLDSIRERIAGDCHDFFVNVIDRGRFLYLPGPQLFDVAAFGL